MGPRAREVADIFSPRLSSRQKNSAMTMVFFSKPNHCHRGTKPLSSRNFACEISATSAERRPCFGRGKIAPRSREVADIFSPRLSSRQKNSAMTMVFFRDDNCFVSAAGRRGEDGFSPFHFLPPSHFPTQNLEKISPSNSSSPKAPVRDANSSRARRKLSAANSECAQSRRARRVKVNADSSARR